jgi:hypothetical protein
MVPEKICPFMSRPADKNSTGAFIPCQREHCMAWVPEYRMTPVGIVQAHCAIMGLETATAQKPGGISSSSTYSYLKDID